MESVATTYVPFGSILFEYYVTFPVFNVVLSNTSDSYVQSNGQNSLEAQYTILPGPFYQMFDVGISMTRHFICRYGHMIHEVSLLMGFNKASAIIFYVSRLGFKGQDGLRT